MRWRTIEISTFVINLFSALQSLADTPLWYVEHWLYHVRTVQRTHTFSGEQIIIRQNTSYMHAACWGYGYACGRRWGQSYSIYLPLHTNIKLLTTYLSLSLLVGLVTRLTFNLLQCSRTYFPSGLSDPQSSFPCQKYFVFRLSLANLLGRGPRMASIIARCSRLSWV